MSKNSIFPRHAYKYSPYIIAEIGVNHENSYDTAVKIIDLAKEGGADAVKFQFIKPAELVHPNLKPYNPNSKYKNQNPKPQNPNPKSTVPKSLIKKWQTKHPKSKT